MEPGTEGGVDEEPIMEAGTNSEDGGESEEVAVLVKKGADVKEGFFLGGICMRGLLLSLPDSSMIDFIRFVDDFSEAFLFAPGFFPLLFGIPTSDIFVMFTPLCFFVKLFSSESRQYFCLATATM